MINDDALIPNTVLSSRPVTRRRTSPGGSAAAPSVGAAVWTVRSSGAD
jgi:hypothetical protein